MMAGAGVSVGGAGMLRTRRRDVSVKPNRKLDRKSSRGMIYENEELRLRTIHINAEVEQGQNDIKKLRRENEQLRREIWSLRDEYDKLEEILKKQKSRGESEEYEDRSEEDDNGVPSDFSCEEDEETNGGPTEDLNKEEQLENAENQKISSEKMTSNSLHRLHVDFDDLSVVDEEEEIKKDKEKKEATLTEESQQQQRAETKNTILLPRQLHENIPFYPATYESPNTFSSSSYYTECPFQFPSTIDLMLPADTPGLLASPCSRLHADPLIPLVGLDAPSLEQTANRMLPQIRVPAAGWQANLVLPQEQLPSYSTVNATTAAVPSAGMQLFGAQAPHVHQDAQPKQQQFGSGMETASFTAAPTLMQRRNNVSKQSINFFDSKPFDSLRAQRSAAEKPISENGWMFDASSASARQNETGDQTLQNDPEVEDKNLEGIFTFGGSDRPKHFFSPLPSKLKKSTEGGSPTTSHFGTGNSSSSGKTGSTVISKSQYAIQKGSADICVNGAIACEDNLQRDGQKTFLSTDNLLIIDDKSGTTNQLTKSMSCQDLISESHSGAISQHLKINQGEAKQQILTQSDNTLDSLTSHKDSKPFKSHLNVTLKMPKTGQLASPDTPEIPKLPSIDYRLLKNPFLRNLEQTSRNYTDQNSPATRPLSVQVNDDNFCYHYPNPPNVSAFNRGFHPEDRYRTLHGKSDQNRLLIPSNQLINEQILSPLNKHEIQVTSFERPSPHTLIPPATPYDLNTLRKINTNPYLQNRSLYQNIPFVPRGPAPLYPQGAPMRMYYDNVAIKVPAQTQTSIDGDSHQEDDQTLSQQDEGSIGAPGSPAGQKRRKTVKKEKTFSPGKDQKPLSPAAQRRLRKQSSVTSTETVDSPSKLTRKRPRKLSVTTTTTSEAQEDKNESRSSSSGQDSPRKDQTRRVSLYFNAKKRPSLTSVKTARSGSLDTTKDKYIDGVLNSERERTNSISSRETTNVKTRKASTSSGKVPWCACWGNGCI